jgi:thymidylate synthase
METEYFRLIRRILDDGIDVTGRNGGTRCVFGDQLRFRLTDELGHMRVPLLTARQVFWRGIVEELLWFLRGETNCRSLQERGVHIWDANGSREFLDSRGLHTYPVGELGPVYGSQWRSWGRSVDLAIDEALDKALSQVMGPDPHKELDRKVQTLTCFREAMAVAGSVDQLADVIRQLRTDPESRRMVVSAWNPTDIPRMALPSCHVLFQFRSLPARYPDYPRRLSCQVYQRSCDVMLGAPFNIASYALLTHMIAAVTGHQADELVYTVGDAHIYDQHLEEAREILEMPTYSSPRLELDPVEDIDDYRAEGIHLRDYLHGLKMDMKMVA